jgi:O-glycosyl hydrolase
MLGFGGAVSHWNESVNGVFNTRQFQQMIVYDLGLTVFRVAVPPAIQAVEDLNTNVLDLSRFNMGAFGTPGTVVSSLYHMIPQQAKIVGSLWSPPAWMKDNTNTISGHLRPDRRPHLAKYLAGIALGFQTNFGFPLYALSMQNEPLFYEPYDSCKYRLTGMDWWGGYVEDEYYQAFRFIPWAFQRWGAQVKLFGPEGMGKDTDQILDYLRPILQDPTTAPYISAVAVHGYGNDGATPEGANPNDAEELRAIFAPYGRPIWMSESSGEGTNWSSYIPLAGGGYRYEKGALHLAWAMHVCVAHASQQAYLYWTVGDSPGDGKFCLIQLFTPSSKYYAFKHFSRWVRPDAVRIGATPTSTNLGVSAFVHLSNQTVAVVLVNPQKKNTVADLTFTNLPWQLASLNCYRSSATEQHVRVPAVAVTNNRCSVLAPAESVITLYGSVASNALPLMPYVVTPANNASNVGLRPRLVASPFVSMKGAPDNQHVVSEWQLWSNGVVALSAAVSDGSLTSLTVTSMLAPAQTYQWRVRYLDSEGFFSPWSSMSTFAVRPNQPPVISPGALLSPAAGATLVAGELATFTWDPGAIYDEEDGDVAAIARVSVVAFSNGVARAVAGSNLNRLWGFWNWTPGAELADLEPCAYRFEVADHAGLTNMMTFSNRWFVVAPEPGMVVLLWLVGAFLVVRWKA